MLRLRLEAFGAVQIVGPKWCGKTTTAMQQSKSVIKMQDPDKREGYLATEERRVGKEGRSRWSPYHQKTDWKFFQVFYILP